MKKEKEDFLASAPISTRAKNALREEGADLLTSKLELERAIRLGFLNLRWTPNMGPVTIKEVFEWLGIEEDPMDLQNATYSNRSEVNGAWGALISAVTREFNGSDLSFPNEFRAYEFVRKAVTEALGRDPLAGKTNP